MTGLETVVAFVALTLAFLLSTPWMAVGLGLMLAGAWRQELYIVAVGALWAWLVSPRAHDTQGGDSGRPRNA